MRRRLFWLALLVVEILGICLVELQAHSLDDTGSQHKEIAITFDDLPLHGPRIDLQKSFENFIAARGYQIAPVTISVSDWMILPAYTNARMQGGPEVMKRVSDEYLKFAELRFDFSEKVTTELFGHQIKHILLLH